MMTSISTSLSRSLLLHSGGDAKGQVDQREGWDAPDAHHSPDGQHDEVDHREASEVGHEDGVRGEAAGHRPAHLL